MEEVAVKSSLLTVSLNYLVLGWLYTGWRSSVATIGGRSDSNNSLMDGGFNAVVLFNVKFW